MTERITIENLGPIGRFELEPKPLTLLIGEQATGKSLVAQLLYFFRGLWQHFKEKYRPGIVDRDGWQRDVVLEMLNDLRGVSISAFANSLSSVRYQSIPHGVDWRINFEPDGETILVDESMQGELLRWLDQLMADPEVMRRVVAEPMQVFLPTERSLITRLLTVQPSAIYSSQPQPVRSFASFLNMVTQVYEEDSTKTLIQSLRHPSDYQELERDGRLLRLYTVLMSQLDALGGMAGVAAGMGRKWVWFLRDQRAAQPIPIEAASSGQMEAWPFYACAVFAAIGPLKLDCYFEEPESHLHPAAQVEVMKTVALLVSLGHRFVITTHSPFIGYVIDNLIQRHIKYKGDIPKGQVALDPENVAAFLMKANREEPEDIVDREETKLLDLRNLEGVADDLEEEFDHLLYDED